MNGEITYEKVSQTDNVDETLSESNDNVERYAIRRQALRGRFRQHGWTVLNVLILLAQMVLFGLIWTTVRSLKKEQGSTLHKQFGTDFNYMSLDEDYDTYWESDEIHHAGTIVLKEHDGRYWDVEYGAISM